jgi:YVTN family beta-propeller protein
VLKKVNSTSARWRSGLGGVKTRAKGSLPGIRLEAGGTTMRRVTVREWSLSLVVLVCGQAPTRLLLAALLFSSPAAIAGGLTNPAVIDTIPVPIHAFGVAVNPGTDRLYVSAGDFSGLVSVIDTQTDKEITEIPVGDGPQGIAANPVTNRVYVVNVRDQTVSVIDANINKVIDTIPGLDFRARLLGINPTTNTIYVGNEGNGTGTTLAVINGFTDRIIQNIPVGTGPHGVAVNPNTNRIYTANDTSNTVSVVDGSTNTVIATIPVGLHPQDLAVNSSTNRIYVSNNEGNTMSVIDGNNNSVIDTIPVGNGPRGIAVDAFADQVYLTNRLDNTFSVIDGITDKVIFTIPVGPLPATVAFDPVANRAYVGNEGGPFVSVIGNVPEPWSILLLGLGTSGVVGFTYLRRWPGRPRRATN